VELWYCGADCFTVGDNRVAMVSSNRQKDSGNSASSERTQRAEEAFIRGLIERGEAARADEHGNLPPGATHEIIGVSESGLPIVVRRRFYSR
jgi:hypothetical protein